MKRYLTEIVLGVILLIGLVVRVYNLSDLPEGFFADEAAIGYNAYTILHFGTDEYGKELPLFFQSFGDYKTPVEIYSTVPSILLFGLNEFSVRVVGALYGVLAVGALYFLTQELFYESKQKKVIALLSTLLLAISPWAIHISRITMEGFMPFVFFVVLGTYFFLRSRRAVHFFPLAVLAFSIGMYTYFPSRLFIPVFFLFSLAVFPKTIPRKITPIILSILIVVMFALPYVGSMEDGTFAARINQVSIFTDPPKEESVLEHITTNYFRHFSMDFLFTKGDIDMPGQFITRQSVRGIGEMYLFELPLILAGFFYLFHKKMRVGIFLLGWVLLYPLGSMFTINESPYATRSIIGVLPLTLLSGIGLWNVFMLCKHLGKYVGYIGVLIITLIVMVSFGSFVHLYFQVYPLYSSDYWGWQYGAGPVMKYFVAHANEYDDMALAGDFNSPDIFIKFYDPTNLCDGKCKISSPTDIYDPTKRQLFALTPDDIKRSPQFTYHTVGTVYYPNNQEAFRLVTVHKN